MMYVKQLFSREKDSTIIIHTKKQEYTCKDLHNAILFARRK